MEKNDKKTDQSAIDLLKKQFEEQIEKIKMPYERVRRKLLLINLVT